MVYLITTSVQQEYVFLAALLVYLVLKTKSEVAAMKAVEKNTTIPVAKIILYGADKGISDKAS